MKYFRLSFDDYRIATQEVWNRQDAAGVLLTTFVTRSHGLDTSTHTESPEGEELLRSVLNELGISYEEGNSQQVH